MAYWENTDDTGGLPYLNRDTLYIQGTTKMNDPDRIVTHDSSHATAGVYRYDVSKNGYSTISPNNLEHFNRYRWIYPDEELESLTYYVFMVKPDMNIMNPDHAKAQHINSDECLSPALHNDATIKMINAENPGLLKMLSASSYTKDYYGTGSHDFIPFLVGRTNSYQLSDYSLASYEDAQLFTGYKFIYPGNANASLSGVTMDIEFREDRNLSVSKFFYVWAYYIDGILKGHFVPYNRYVGTKIADYMTSIYFFACGPDGSEIKFYGKLVGAYPTNIPLSNWGFQGINNVSNTISISFAGAAPEVMNPTILMEFNHNAGLYNMRTGSGALTNGFGVNDWVKTNSLPSYHELSRMPNWNAERPFVVRSNGKEGTEGGSGPMKYYLMWAGNQFRGTIPRNENTTTSTSSKYNGGTSGGGSKYTEAIY